MNEKCRSERINPNNRIVKRIETVIHLPISFLPRVLTLIKNRVVKKKEKEKKTKHPIIVSTNPNYGTETRVDLHYFRVN